MRSAAMQPFKSLHDTYIEINEQDYNIIHFILYLYLNIMSYSVKFIDNVFLYYYDKATAMLLIVSTV